MNILTFLNSLPTFVFAVKYTFNNNIGICEKQTYKSSTCMIMLVYRYSAPNYSSDYFHVLIVCTIVICK